jgi:DNA-binding NtrC family response regulator
MLTTALEEEGWRVTAVSDAPEAFDALGRGGFDLVLTDLKLPGEGSGMDVLRRAGEICGGAPVLLMTAFGTIDLAVEAMKGGAADFITKPFDLEDLIARVRRLAGRPGMRIVGGSRAMERVLARARRAASTGMAVLLLGESGTGKELLARFVHESCGDGKAPFVPVNCAAIPAELMESELFGAEKGAYTGAESAREGFFQRAEGGTIFLDEVADLSPRLQGKLLRVLQEREYTRVGSPEPHSSSARVVAASNRDLELEMEKGGFRRDLYYRLSQFPIEIPPLRERTEDIPELARYFLDSAGYTSTEVEPKALEALAAYGWPGNVRELRSIVLRAAAMADEGGSIGPGLLEIGGALERAGEGGLLEASSRAARRRERELIVLALRRCDGNRSKAAEMLKVSYRTLLSRIKDLDLD